MDKTDSELAEALADIKTATEQVRENRVTEVSSEPVVRIKLNRAERRAQVKFYASMLASTERQTPVINPTIISRADRRRQKQQRSHK